MYLLVFHPPFSLLDRKKSCDDPENWDQDYLVTRYYRAPEFTEEGSFKENIEFERYKRVDLWSLGLILWELDSFCLYHFRSHCDELQLQSIVNVIILNLYKLKSRQEEAREERDDVFLLGMDEVVENIRKGASYTEWLYILSQFHPSFWCGRSHPEPLLLSLKPRERKFQDD